MDDKSAEQQLNQLILDGLEVGEDYSDDWIGFSENELNLFSTPDQERVIESVRLNTRTVVESGHGVGKSVIAAGLACAWMTINEGASVKCVTFAPTHQQVQNILWRYIRAYGRQAGLEGRILDTPRWEFGTAFPEKFAIGVSPRRSSEQDMAGVQGYHAPALLIILDECAGLPKILWDAVETLQPTRILAIGNPIEQSGPFWNAANSKLWNRINISCLNHPNVIQDKSVVPGAVTREWVEGMLTEHCQIAAAGEPDAFYLDWKDKWYIPDARFQSRVMGIAPTEAPDQLISMAWVESAKLTSLAASGEITISLDPARRGGDAFAIAIKQGYRVLRVEMMYATKNDPTAEVVGWFLALAAEYQAVRGFIDEGGMGGPILDVARREADFSIVGINSSSRASDPSNYHNMRSYCWGMMRNAFRKGQVDLPNNLILSTMDKLESDLTVPKYSYDHQGRMKLESKDEIMKRLGRSPDAGDAVSLLYARPTESTGQLMPSVLSIGHGDGGRGRGGSQSRWFVSRPKGRGSKWRR